MCQICESLEGMTYYEQTLLENQPGEFRFDVGDSVLAHKPSKDVCTTGQVTSRRVVKIMEDDNCVRSVNRYGVVLDGSVGVQPFSDYELEPDTRGYACSVSPTLPQIAARLNAARDDGLPRRDREKLWDSTLRDRMQARAAAQADGHECSVRGCTENAHRRQSFAGTIRYLCQYHWAIGHDVATRVMAVK